MPQFHWMHITDIPGSDAPQTILGYQPKGSLQVYWFETVHPEHRADMPNPKTLSSLTFDTFIRSIFEVSGSLPDSHVAPKAVVFGENHVDVHTLCAQRLVMRLLRCSQLDKNRPGAYNLWLKEAVETSRPPHKSGRAYSTFSLTSIAKHIDRAIDFAQKIETGDVHTLLFQTGLNEHSALYFSGLEPDMNLYQKLLTLHTQERRLLELNKHHKSLRSQLERIVEQMREKFLTPSQLDLSTLLLRKPLGPQLLSLILKPRLTLFARFLSTQDKIKRAEHDIHAEEKRIEAERESTGLTIEAAVARLDKSFPAALGRALSAPDVQTVFATVGCDHLDRAGALSPLDSRPIVPHLVLRQSTDETKVMMSSLARHPQPGKKMRATNI